MIGIVMMVMGDYENDDDDNNNNNNNNNNNTATHERHTHRKSVLGEFVKKMGKQNNEWENINSWFKNTKNDRQCRNSSV
jgi:hypothetical protein